MDLKTMHWVSSGAFPPSTPQPKPTPQFSWRDKRFRLFWDGYMKLEMFTITEYYNMRSWLKDNLSKKGYKIKDNPTWADMFFRNKNKKTTCLIYFKDKEDAAAFKLRWQ